jgi:phosphoribosylaminoimidazolecarboxamide formyltransferase/IMP cyclohydrolase
MNLIEKLRYGENPHQESAIYSTQKDLNIKQIHGKKLSYNNYNDIFSALIISKSLPKNTGTVIVKHASPCGVSALKDQLNSYQSALACDPVSAFGAIVSCNYKIKKKLAIELNKIFFEVIIARGFKKDAFNILKKRKNIRLINSNKYISINKKHYLFLDNVFLSQDVDDKLLNNKIKIVTKNKPSGNQLGSLKFAFNICKFVKSNAIVLVNEKSTIGIGAGQPSRIDSCKIAVEKSLKFVPEKINNSVAASDAFFPFPDGIEELANAGVKAIIQPGGSINDKKIIKAANDAKLIMAFTGTRHFKH